MAQPSHRYHLARLPIANAVRADMSRIREKLSAPRSRRSPIPSP
jgi:hypothetical protein